MSYPGEPDRFSKRLVGVGDGTCWVSIGGQCGNLAGLYDVTKQSDYPRNVVNLEQIMDAPSDDDIRTLVKSAHDEALMARRRRNLLVNRQPSFFISWSGERLDVPASGLLSGVMGVASRNRTAFPPAEVSLEREAALPVTPPSARVFSVDVFSRVIDEPVRDIIGKPVFVTEDGVFLSW